MKTVSLLLIWLGLSLALAAWLPIPTAPDLHTYHPAGMTAPLQGIVHAPRLARSGKTFDVRLEVDAAQGATPPRVLLARLEVPGAPPPASEQNRTLAAGRSTFTWPVRLPSSGFYELRLWLVLVDADQNREALMARTWVIRAAGPGSWFWDGLGGLGVAGLATGAALAVQARRRGKKQPPAR